MQKDHEEHVKEIVSKIGRLFPDIDKETLVKKAMQMSIVENEDITDTKGVSYDQLTNTLKLNVDEIDKYDLEYYFTVALLMMNNQPSEALEGVRYGYYSGIASALVGNTTLETPDKVEPGIDLYESLRECIADLSSKIGPDATCQICAVHNEELFHQLYIGAGLEDPVSFLNQMNYLYKNAYNVEPTKLDQIINGIKASIVSPVKAKTL